MIFSLVSVMQNLGPGDPSAFVTRKGFCSVHGQDVLVQVRFELNNNITNVTSGDGPLVDNFLVFNESLNTRVGVVTVFAGKHSGRQKNLYSGENKYVSNVPN